MSVSEATKQIIDRAGEALAKETGAVAVMLTGPHALGIDRPEDKIYLVAITDDPEGVIEHRFAQSYAGVDRQMEIGIFPRKFVEKLTAEGYWDMVSLRAAEVLRIAQPLADQTGYGKASAEAMARHLPEKRFISGRIHGIKATFDDAVSLYSKGDYAGAVLVAREAVGLAVDLILKQAPAGSGSDEALRAALGEDGYALLLEALGVDKMSQGDLKRRLDDLEALSRRILKDLGIDQEALGG